jgi:DNA repair protein RadC
MSALVLPELERPASQTGDAEVEPTAPSLVVVRRDVSVAASARDHPEVRGLLATIFHTGGPGYSAYDLADELLARFPTMRSLIEAEACELAEVRGIGLARAAQVKAALQLGHRLEFSPTERITVRGAKDVYRAARRYQTSLRSECLVVVVCTVSGRVQHIEPMPPQHPLTLDEYPAQEIVRLVQRCGGRGLALAHTPPRANVTPRRAQYLMAERLAVAATDAGLRFRGYVLIGYHEWTRVPTDRERRPQPGMRKRTPRVLPCLNPCRRRDGRYSRMLVGPR